MPTLAFEASSLGPAITIEAEGRLLDIVDDARAPVAFSCRGATCGTCLIEVLAGAEQLDPAGPDERSLLAQLGAPAASRLACQAVVRPGPGLVRVRCVRDTP